MDTTTTTKDATQDVATTHTRFWNALLAADTAALDTLLADDLTFCTPFGTTVTKAGYVGALRSGQLSYNSAKDEEPVIRLHGQTAIVTGRADIAYQTAGNVALAPLYYTAVYGWTAPHWRMLAWHATQRGDAEG